MIILYVILGIIALISISYIVSISPGRPRRHLLKPFMNTYIAHRGFFNNRAIPENSLLSFKAAVERGYAIELDVQLTSDGEMVVFHDNTLKRMCNVKKRVSDCTYDELCTYRLLATDCMIPHFSDVLSLVDGKVPLLIEVKPHGDVMGTTKELERMLRTYKGVYAVQSFHPSVCSFYKKYRPEVPRGLLSTHYKKDKLKKGFPISFIMTNLLLNFTVKPDFIAYNHKYADQPSLRLMRKLYKTPCAAWTLRSPEELKKAKDGFDMFIFDSFEPR